MTLKALYEKEEDIPENYRELYKATADGFKLMGFVPEDEYRSKEKMALEEKKNYQRLKEKTKEYFGDTPFEEIAQKLKASSQPEKSEGSGDIDKILDAKIKEMKHDYEAMLRKKEDALLEQSKQSQMLLEQIESFKEREDLSRIQSEVRKAGVQMKMREEAISDLLELSRLYFSVNDSGSVRTFENQTPVQYLEEIQRNGQKPHWWPDPVGGGSRGGSGLGQYEKNPWSKESSNFTEQLRILREAPEKAERLKQLAGIHSKK